MEKSKLIRGTFYDLGDMRVTVKAEDNDFRIFGVSMYNNSETINSIIKEDFEEFVKAIYNDWKNNKDY